MTPDLITAAREAREMMLRLLDTEHRNDVGPLIDRLSTAIEGAERGSDDEALLRMGRQFQETMRGEPARRDAGRNANINAMRAALKAMEHPND